MLPRLRTFTVQLILFACFMLQSNTGAAQPSLSTYHEVIAEVAKLEHMSAADLDHLLSHRVLSEGVSAERFLNTPRMRSHWTALDPLLRKVKESSAWFLDFTEYNGERFPFVLVVELPASHRISGSVEKTNTFSNQNTETDTIRSEALSLINTMILSFGSNQALLNDQQQRFALILLPDLPTILRDYASAEEERRPLRRLQRLYQRTTWRIARFYDFILSFFLPPS